MPPIQLPPPVHPLLPQISLIKCGCTAAERTSKRANKRASSIHYNSIGIQSITFSHIMLLYLIILSFHRQHTHSHTQYSDRKNICRCLSTHRLLSLTLSRSLSIRFFSIVPVDWITVCVNSQCDAAVIILDFSIHITLWYTCQKPDCLPASQPACWMWIIWRAAFTMRLLNRNRKVISVRYIYNVFVCVLCMPTSGAFALRASLLFFFLPLVDSMHHSDISSMEIATVCLFQAMNFL